MTDGFREMQPHELDELNSEATFPGAGLGEDGVMRCFAWVPVPCDDGHRPDDDPEDGDRCKDCRWDLTWMGGNDWAPTNPPEDADPAFVPHHRRWTVALLVDPDGSEDDMRYMPAGVYRGWHKDESESVLSGGYDRITSHVDAADAEEAEDKAFAELAYADDDEITDQPRTVWNTHTNDIGDHCPFSGEPVDEEDEECPQGCAASARTVVESDARAPGTTAEGEAIPGALLDR